MRASLPLWIVYVGVAFTSLGSTSEALAAPKAGPAKAPQAGDRSGDRSGERSSAPASAEAHHKRAAQLDRAGDYDKALDEANKGIALDPKHLKLLKLKGEVLLKLRDYENALAAYEAYLAADPPKGQDLRVAQKIVKDLEAVKVTFLEITATSGPAAVYLDTRTLGVFCTAAPGCKKGVLPGTYSVIVEKPGFDKWSQDVEVARGEVKPVTAALAEKPSRLTVRVAQPGATVTVGDKPHEAPGPIPAGKHPVEVSLAGHVTKRLEVEAREGKPIELDVALVPAVAITVSPAGAALTLDGAPISIADGAIPVEPGPHVLVATAQGHEARELEIPAERPADYKLEVALVPVQIVVRAPAPSPFTLRRKVALAAAGVGLAALGGGVLLGRNAEQLEADAFTLCPAPERPCADAGRAQAFNDRARARALHANLAYGVAGGAVIAAAVLWLTGAPEAREPRVAVRASLGPISAIDLALRF